MKTILLQVGDAPFPVGKVVSFCTVSWDIPNLLTTMNLRIQNHQSTGHD